MKARALTNGSADLQSSEGAKGDRPPNVLLILTDQQTYFALGAAGNRDVRTPHLDRLAANGAFFTHCIVPTPYCSPARASILTGLQTHKHGVWSNVDRDRHLPSLDDQKFPVTEEILNRNGYTTLHWGKLHVCNKNTRPNAFVHTPWHCNSDFTCYETYPAEILRKRRDRQDACERAARQAGYSDWWSWLTDPKYVETIPEVAGAASGYVNKIGKAACPAAYRREHFFGVELMEAMQLHRDRPWMFTLSYHPPHKPWNVPEPYYSMYDPSELCVPDNQGTEMADGMAASGSAAGGRMIGPKGRKEWLRVYYGQVTMIDTLIGKVLDKLDALDLTEDTLIIFTSDHGDMSCSHGAVGKNITAFFEYLIRVPLIVSYPRRIRKGLRISELTTPMDLLPTLLDYTGLRHETPPGIDGRSLRPLLEEQGPNWRTFVIGMRDYPPTARINTQYMIRTKRWKYWWNYRQDLESRLYDLDRDPLEQHNLIKDPAHRDIAQQLHTTLAQWLQTEKPRHYERVLGSPLTGATTTEGGGTAPA